MRTLWFMTGAKVMSSIGGCGFQLEEPDTSQAMYIGWLHLKSSPIVWEAKVKSSIGGVWISIGIAKYLIDYTLSDSIWNLHPLCETLKYLCLP